MEVVVLVPAPALRREVEGRAGAVVVVAVVTGRVRVDVTGRGRLVVGRVRVDVVGRVGAAVVVMVGGGGAVVAGAVPVPATGWERKRIQGIIHIDRVGQIKILNLLFQLGTIHGSSQFCHHVRHAAEILGWRGRRCGGAHAGG